MNLAKDFKKLKAKEILLLFLPVIVGGFLSIVFYPFLQNILYSLFEKNLNYSLKIPEIDFKIRKSPKIYQETVSSLLEIKPYKAPLQMDRPANINKNPAPSYKISFIYIGKNKYVIINNKLWSEGDTLPSGEKILRITRNGILVTGKWGERWIKFLR